MAGIGALPPTSPAGVPSAAQVGATAPISLSNLGATQKQENLGYALGGVYDAYQKAQADDLTRQTEMTKMGRDRLAQLWELGTKNPQLQKDPRVHQQIQALYNQMHLPMPIDPTTGQIDWNQLQPVKQFADLKSDMIAHLAQMPTEQRKATMKALNIVGADPSFENAPPQWTAQQIAKMNTDMSNIMRDIGDPKKGMTAEAFAQWVQGNRVGLNQQANDPTYADSLLNNGKLFDQFSAASIARMRKLADDSKMSAEKRKEMEAQISGIHDLDSLRQAESKYFKVKTDAYPQEIQSRINQMNASAQRDTAAAGLAQAEVTKIQAGLAVNPPNMSVLLTAQAKAQTSYQEAIRTMNMALGPNGGGSTPELEQAVATAKQNYDQITAAVNAIKTPEMQARVRALKSASVTGQRVQSVGAGQDVQMTTIPGAKYNGQTGLVQVDQYGNYYFNGKQIPK